MDTKWLIEYFNNESSHKIAILLIVLVGFFFLFKRNNFILVNTDRNVRIELYDCLEDLEHDSLNEVIFIPKKVKYLVIHCTGSIKDQSKEDLWKVFRERWGKNTRPGYNYAINKQGKVYVFRDIDKDNYIGQHEIANGVSGYNSESIHIAITGGYYENNMTMSQLVALDYLVDKFKKQFPNIIVIGHRELASKDKNKDGKITPNEWVKPCPRFTVLGKF